jgi:hypothetical protein
LNLVELDARSDHLEDAGEHAHLEAVLLEIAHALEHAVVGVVLSDDHTVDVALDHVAGEGRVSRAVELEALERQVGDDVGVDGVGGVELGADRVGLLLGAEHHASLRPRRRAAGLARRRATDHRADEQRCPEDRDRLDGERGRARRHDHGHDQRVKRRQLKQRRRLVQGRLADQQLVAVIEADRLAYHDYREHADVKDRGLLGNAGQGLGDQESGEGTENIRHRQGATEDRVALRRAPGDDRLRAFQRQLAQGGDRRLRDRRRGTQLAQASDHLLVAGAGFQRPRTRIRAPKAMAPAPEPLATPGLSFDDG